MSQQGKRRVEPYEALFYGDATDDSENPQVFDYETYEHEELQSPESIRILELEWIEEESNSLRDSAG